MKKSLLVLPFACFLFFMLYSSGFNRPGATNISTGTNAGFALVELFTSEGCSSCPPADEAVAALTKEYPANVYVLSFHVDYWNYLGWKDEFSSPGNTNRQQQYAAVFNINSIYTPQAIVNGSTEFTGSDKKKLYVAVKDGLERKSNIAIDLSAKVNGTNNITISYKTSIDNKSVLQLAIVQSSASSAVKRGENKGLLLHHVNVVRALKTAGNSSGTENMVLPAGLAAKECRVIAFVQNKSDLHITGANSCSIQ